MPKLPIGLVYDQTDSDDLKAKIEVEWIDHDLVDQQKKEMRAMSDFVAANRNAALFRASTQDGWTMRGANFELGINVSDQGTKVGVYP